MIDNIVDFVRWQKGTDSRDEDVAEALDSQRKAGDGNPRVARSHISGSAGSGVLDRINEDIHMARVERRVSNYLERIQQAQKNGNFQRIVQEDGQNAKVSSWEQLHRAHLHNRHVYFAGMPLSHSKEIVQLKRNEWKLSKQMEEILAKLNEREEQIEELLNKQHVNFLKYESAIRKAMGIGMGCSLFSEVIGRVTNRQKRGFFLVSRVHEKKQLEESLESQARLLKRNRQLAGLVIAGRLEILVVSTLREALVQLRMANSTLPLKEHQMSKLSGKQRNSDMYKLKQMMIDHEVKKSGKHGKHKETVEQSLLARLEHLVAEEMDILTSR